MSSVKKIGGRLEVVPTKERLGNLVPAVSSDEAINLAQLTTNSISKTDGGTNTYTGTNTYSGAIVSSLTTESSSSTTGAIKTAGGLGVAKNATIGGQLVANKNLVRAITPYTAATDTTAGWTLTEVKTALVAGGFKTTSAAAVTLTLDSVANIITAFATAGVTITTGSTIEFSIDNTQGANTVTLAVDGGATIAVATSPITGGATLTVSTANKVGRFQLYLASATTGILSRVV
jgi:hypothetical protein